MAQKIIFADELKFLCEKIFLAVGADEEEAKIVSESLVESNLLGVDSHGVMRVPDYVKMVKEGRIRVRAEIKVVKDKGATVLVDGGFGFGQVIARKAANLALERANSLGVGVVGIVRSNHIGRLGEYTTFIAEHDMIGIMFCNSGPKGGIVAPYGGALRRFGTNPLSIAFPSHNRPFLLDFATSIVAEGKLRRKYILKERIPEGWVIDKEGNISTDPADFYERYGALLPFGEHKGYALSMAVDALGGILTGAHFVSHPDFVGGNNALLIALNISNFRPIEEFKSEVDDFFKVIGNTSPAKGFQKVVVPGEIEYSVREKRLKEGVPIDIEIWQRIEDVAKELGVTLA
ncbi:MAG: Ldh family oxidoreductase [Nitrososphaeria archaeon]|nr:Ldh family oxidoreductase [Nitrososphaeria archaeon]